MSKLLVSEITPDHFAQSSSLTLNELWRYANSTDRQYQPPRKREVRGKEREFDVPKYHFQKILKNLHDRLLNLNMFHKSAYGGVKKRSPQKSARRHCGKRLIFVRDIKNCFPSITTQMLKNKLLEAGFRLDTAKLLSSLLTVRGRVPQGANTSMDAINLFFLKIDERVSLECKKHDFSYTRYVDDCVISGDDESVGKELVRYLENQLELAGLVINRKKSVNTYANSRKQKVQGFLVHRPSGTTTTPEKKKIALQIAGDYVASCRSISLITLSEVVDARKRLLGHWASCKTADFNIAKHLKRLINVGDRLALSGLKKMGLEYSPNEKWWSQPAVQPKPS